MAVKLEPKCSLGVASARHVSGLVVKGENSSYFFDAPLGPSVVRWNLEKGERSFQFQAHSDLVVCMRASPNGKYIATASTGGEIKLWNDQWKLLAETTAPVQSLFHLSWSDGNDRFLIASNGVKSSAMMFNITSNVTLECVWHAFAGQFTKRDPSVSHDQSHDSQVTASGYHYGDLFFMGEINADGSSIVIEEREKACTMMHLYSSSGEVLRSSVLKSLDGKTEVHTLMISSRNNGHYVIMAQGGNVLVIKGAELELVNTIKLSYTSRACAWDNDLIILPSDTGKLVWVDIKTGKQIHEYKAVSSDFVVHIEWSSDSNGLWICGFSNLTYCTVTRNDKGVIVGVSSHFSVSTHEISCCGAGFSPDSAHLAVGDLAGNVYLYRCQLNDYHPLEMWNVGASIRCLEWIDNDSILIGCLDGLVHLWRIGEGIKVYFAMEGSVIHIRLNNNKQYFAVGSSKGKVGIFCVDNNDGQEVGVASNKALVCPVSVFTAHKPQPGNHDNRFGQLGKQAEVWSLSWSPDDTKLATCSEDQTVRVWEAGSWVAVTTLKGHSLAVTSVDWKSISGQSLLVSCSDDRTIRLYDSNRDYHLIRVMDTKDIFGWHTLTYLAFCPQKDSDLLMVVTQHGFLVLFNALTGVRLFGRKMHCGSVEGLRWEGLNSQIATVGGDCAAFVWNVCKE